MSESTLTDTEIAEREERFRYVDLDHPLMQVLFHMQLNKDRQQESAS